MAAYLPQPDGSDTCCDCPDRTSPCDDCGTGPESCPEVSYTISGTITVDCGDDCSDTITGAVNFIGSGVYEGSAGSALCGSGPSVRLLCAIGDGWYVDLFYASPGFPLYYNCDAAWQTDSSGDNWVFITSNATPEGTYSIDLDLIAGGPGTCHVELVIS